MKVIKKGHYRKWILNGILDYNEVDCVEMENNEKYGSIQGLQQMWTLLPPLGCSDNPNAGRAGTHATALHNLTARDTMGTFTWP